MSFKIIKKITILLGALIISSYLAAGVIMADDSLDYGGEPEIYVDENGKVHVSDEIGGSDTSNENEVYYEYSGSASSSKYTGESGVIGDFINALVAMANNNKIGYNNLTKGYEGYYGDPDLDCGYFVSRGLQAAGLFDESTDQVFEPNGDNGTSGFGIYNPALNEAGFVGYNYAGEDLLLPGDILINDGHHTEVYIGNGKLAGARDTDGHPEPGDQTGTEVSVSNFYEGGWDYVYSYAGDRDAVTKIVTLEKDQFEYTGKKITPKIKVFYGDEQLDEKTDYSVEYKDNLKPGTASVTVTLNGDYEGKITETFDILPKPAELASVIVKNDSLVVRWTKQKEEVSGYQVQYSQEKSFDNQTTVTINNSDISSYTIKKLKTGKKYFVRIRSFKTSQGEKYFSEWSKIKSTTA